MSTVLLIVIGIVAIVAIPVLLVAATGGLGLIRADHPLPRPATNRQRARRRAER